MPILRNHMMPSAITHFIVPFTRALFECVLRFRVQKVDMRRDIGLEPNVVDVGMRKYVGIKKRR